MHHYHNDVVMGECQMTKNERKEFSTCLHFCKSITEHISVQSFLYILAFTTFGIGDALTGALLMSIKGVGAESNAFFSQMYSSQGPGMFIVFKIWVTVVILSLVFISYIHSHGKDYWATNGFLAALSIGGIMAIQANIQAINGYNFMNPFNIITIFLTLVLVFVTFGEILDSNVSRKSNQEIIPYHSDLSELNYPNLNENRHPWTASAHSRNDERK